MIQAAWDIAAGAKVLAGAAGGALLGALLARARTCSAAACDVKARWVFSVLGGAVFGAAVAWYFLNR